MSKSMCFYLLNNPMFTAFYESKDFPLRCNTVYYPHIDLVSSQKV